MNELTVKQLGEVLEWLDLASYYFSLDDLVMIFPNGRHIAGKFQEYEENLHKLYAKLDSANREILIVELKHLFDLVQSQQATSMSMAIELRRRQDWQ